MAIFSDGNVTTFARIAKSEGELAQPKSQRSMSQGCILLGQENVHATTFERKAIRTSHLIEVWSIWIVVSKCNKHHYHRRNKEAVKYGKKEAKKYGEISDELLMTSAMTRSCDWLNSTSD